MKERIWGEFLFVNIKYLPIGFFSESDSSIPLPGKIERSWRIGLRSFHLLVHKFEESLFSRISIKEEDDVLNK